MQYGRPVAVLGGVRIPFCRQNTAYADVGNLGLSVRTWARWSKNSACKDSRWAKWRWVR